MNAKQPAKPSLQTPPTINTWVGGKQGPNFYDKVSKSKKASFPGQGATGMSQEAMVNKGHSMMKSGEKHLEREGNMKSSGGKHTVNLSNKGY